MKISTLFKQAADAGVFLHLADGQLKYKLSVSEFPEDIKTQILANKEDIIAFLADREVAPENPAKPELTRINETTEYLPLSYSQQRLWFIDRFEGSSAQYNMPSAFQIDGAFDAAKAELAFKRLLERHQILRTLYKEENGIPYQQVQDDYRFTLRRVSLAHLGQHLQQQRLEQLIREDAETAFNLSKDIMLRATYVDCTDEQNNCKGVLIVNIHHIAADGWSLNIMLGEFSQFYRNPEANLTQLPVQYADYAHWQRQWLSGKALDLQLDWWQKQLADAPAQHGLTLDKARPTVKNHKGEMLTGALDENIAQSLINIAEQYQLTPFMLLHAAFALLLAKHSGSTDIVIGTPVANRPDTSLQGLIGFFVNTLVLRVSTEHHKLADYLTHVRQVHNDAHTYQDIPFELLVDKLAIERNSGLTPLFQIMLSTDNGFGQVESQTQMSDLSLSVIKRKNPSVKCDIELDASIKSSGVHLQWTYDPALFTEQHIAQLNQHLENLLTAIARKPDGELRELSMLSTQEQAELLTGVTRSDELPEDLTSITKQFSDQATQNPDAIALIFKGTQLTYGELETRSNQLARLLQQNGVGPDIVVAICVDRTPQMLINMLAVLKSGGAYLPLDPGYPHARLRHMLSAAKVRHVLTNERYLSLFHGLENLWVFSHDSASSEEVLAGMDNHFYESVQPENLAYIIFTSGSSGTPKGVMIEHGALSNFLAAMKERLNGHLNATSRVLALTTIAFDISTLEIFGPLSQGGTVVLMGQEQTKDPGIIASTIEEHRVNVMQATPSTYQLLLNNQWQGDKNLCILSGGEPLELELAKTLLTKGKSLWNCYGPTEATVWSLVNEISTESLAQDGVVVGHGLSRYSHLVLDHHLQPVPEGVAGELYIGGSSLARGYFNQPALTAERFINNPFCDLLTPTGPQKRLYKTGDMVRNLGLDGAGNQRFAFMGRADNQLKVRGFRIEPGEIEQQLLQSGVLSRCVVVAKENHLQEKYLVAYVVPSDNHKKQIDLTATLQKHAAVHLPVYMQPSVYTQLDSLPLTDNGKIDRRQLPEPQADSSNIEFQAPETSTEKTLVSIWAKLMDLEQNSISANASFFQLGGHSLLAVRLASEIRQQFAVDLKISEIFEANLLSQMAQKIDTTNKLLSQAQPLRLARDCEHYPLSFAQQRLWFIDKLQGQSAEYNMPVSLEIKGVFSLSAAQKALLGIINRHEPLRTIYRESHQGPVQIIATCDEFEIAQIDLSGNALAEQHKQVEQLISAEALRPFDLSSDLMLRVTWLKLAAQHGVLLFNMHHIASDGWSMKLLVKEFVSRYESATQGNEVALPELHLGYIDYAAWQVNIQQQGHFDSQLNYWRQQLADCPPVHDLPLDFARPRIKNHQGKLLTGGLSAEVSQKLKRIAQAHQLTDFMLLQAMFALLISRHSNSKDVVMGAPVANRQHSEWENLIGFFVNTLVLRTNTDHQNFSDYFAHVKALHLAAQNNQDVPFEHLVEQLKVAPSTAQTPIFQIVLTSDVDSGVGQESLNLAGAQVSALKPTAVSVKFDLELNATLSSDGVKLAWKYDTSLFKAATIKRLNEHLERLLSGLAEQHPVRLADLHMLSSEEHHYLTETVNDTSKNYPIEQCLHQLFLDQAVKTPDATALIDSEGRMTYAELLRHCYAVYHYLTQQQVENEELVAIRMPKGRWQLIAALGIMMSGGAYLPLETKWPDERCRSVLETANARLMLAIENKHQVPGVKTCIITNLTVADKPTSHYQNPTTPEKLAYVIFTSGSTGKPKGVAIEHRSAVNTILDINQQYGVTQQDRVLAVSALSFDLSVYDLFGLLQAGGTIIFPEDDKAMDPRHWLSMVEKHQVTIWDTVPASAKLLAEQLEAQQRQSTAPLKVVMMSGDWIDPTVPKRLWQVFPGVKTYSLGGATEGSIWSIHYPILQDTSGWKSVPYGKPLSNQQFYILDSDLLPVPTGVTGELFIGGIGVAREYYGAPDLTAQRFIQHPTLKQKLYRTGDLGRRGEDGIIEFIGRVDFQVKLRGFRIELGEINYQLKHCAEVTSSIVQVKQDQHGNQRLIAYVEPSEGGSLSQEVLSDTLKVQLRKTLLDYMIPEYFIVVQDWPLTANGKVDTKALPLPDTAVSRTQYFAPESETEKVLTKIWAEILNLTQDSISTHHSFTELGGHSLLVVQLALQIQQHLDVSVELRDLYEHNVLTQQARLIDKQQYFATPAMTKLSESNSEEEEFTL